MSVVKINAITVPDGAGPELEARFAARFAQGCMNEVPGFLGYELLRPVAGDTRYFVYTRWEHDAAFQAWRTVGAAAAHCDSDSDRPQVGTGADLLEFETVPLGTASDTAPGTASEEGTATA
ncbi:antibiotic biosynthesis monooxygenase [Pseudonocardia sp. ICBG601]|uniref:antibiotic biosynthesis monooxygenase family protein n=1 Tax=Pseudonocardia sp. ICBG601 TaxID=2846759 RepID=UPI001CF702B3|nr:antibiotic biosynthesis monooxygenase [Pseudonocardia sp. ICBG601]